MGAVLVRQSNAEVLEAFSRAKLFSTNTSRFCSSKEQDKETRVFQAALEKVVSSTSSHRVPCS
jgi:hypothetical protein